MQEENWDWLGKKTGIGSQGGIGCRAQGGRWKLGANGNGECGQQMSGGTEG